MHQGMMSLFEEMLDDEPPVLLRTVASLDLTRDSPAAATAAAPTKASSALGVTNSSLKRQFNTSPYSNATGSDYHSSNGSQLQQANDLQQGHFQQQHQQRCLERGTASATNTGYLSRGQEQQHLSNHVAQTAALQPSKRQKLNSKPMACGTAAQEVTCRPVGYGMQRGNASGITPPAGPQAQNGITGLQAFAFGSGE
jgi:hypothetical protein